MEPGPLRRRRRIAAAAALVVGVLAAGVVARRALRPAGTAVSLGVLGTRDDDEARAPAGVRIRVQVLNTTGVRGLGRRAMLVLRDRGFDVVELGSISPARDSSLVLDVSGHPAWAARAAAALGGARVVARPDSSRYLDVVVLLGRSWRPPAEPLDP